MAAPEKITIDGVTIDSVPAGFVTCRNLWVLWSGSAQRGKDRVIPGANGARAKRRRKTITERSLELLIEGFVDHLGAAHADPRVGLEENVFYLHEFVAEPTNAGDGTRTLTLYLPSGATPSAPAHIGPLELGEGQGPTAVKATLDVSFPGGALT